MSRFQAKTYKRLGAMIGGFIGILMMMIAICMGYYWQGAISVLAFIVFGTIMGSLLERKQNDKKRL